MLGDMKLREKSSVFRRCLKISSGAERAVDGKLFHARAAATLKALSPTVERRVGGILGLMLSTWIHLCVLNIDQARDSHAYRYLQKTEEAVMQQRRQDTWQ